MRVYARQQWASRPCIVCLSATTWNALRMFVIFDNARRLSAGRCRERKRPCNERACHGVRDFGGPCEDQMGGTPLRRRRSLQAPLGSRAARQRLVELCREPLKLSPGEVYLLAGQTAPPTGGPILPSVTCEDVRRRGRPVRSYPHVEVDRRRHPIRE